MSQKQPPISTIKYSQGIKGRERINNDQKSGSVQSQAGKPDVSIKDQNEILDALCETLSVIGEYNKAVKSQKRKSDNSLNKVVDVDLDDTNVDASIIKKRSLIPPPILSNIYFGLNEVTKHLERMTNPQIRSRFNHKNHLSNDNLADLPPQFYSHFPTICCIAGGVLLVSLPLGASKRISEAVNFKGVSCIGVKTNSLAFIRIYKMIRDKVKPIDVPWLNPLKPSENLLKKRKITEDEEELEKETTSLLFNNMIKQKVEVEIATSLYTTKSPSIFFFKQQPKVKI
ncbi:10968_t:CDS:2 [Funneliformis mosseae]|uniref:10968_t:CDS:1 n=1 Tax=Funneliformis mosseae TaxID=27381 RepID=A0A9N9ATA6_FUNMO|nr:10968_t:CDS:2 [Funneliformis mosseae]